MKEYPYSTVFGWEGDEGLGEFLIQQIIKGEKTATCAPKEAYTVEELEETWSMVGNYATVRDKYGNAHCNIYTKEVFETSFGNPDPRLVEGEGFGTDAKAFQEAHHRAWASAQEDGLFNVNEDTVLVVELFRLAEE